MEREGDMAAGNEDQPEERGSDAESSGGETHKEQIDATGIPAPSIGPHTVIEREPPEQRLAKHEQSDVDAMGKDKRRQVVGHAYGPSRRQQITFFAIVGAVILVIWLGWTLAVDAFDTPVKTIHDKAPWSSASAPQTPPHRPF